MSHTREMATQGSMAGEFLETLTHRVRCLTLGQVERAWPQIAAGNEIEKLQHSGLVVRTCVLARPVLELTGPMVAWVPGSAAPNFGQVAYRLKERWTLPVEPTEIVMATSAARRRYGGFLGGRGPRASEISHDVNLAEVYLWFRKARPSEADGWIPEARLYAEGGGRNRCTRLPDAVIRCGGAVELAVEFGGAYSKQKLVTFHREMQEIPYEIW